MVARGGFRENGRDPGANTLDLRAAHVPVIWATQVLESLVKRGLPSRAEVTDAAMSGRAECVMLNKGPHILLALDFLCDVLCRMEGHQAKKSALMRRLRLAELAWK